MMDTFSIDRRTKNLNIPAMILAGGLGTRLRSAVQDVPKVLARVGRRPFITFLLDQLASSGIQKVVLLTGYQADQVRRTLGNKYEGITLTYSVETSPLGTAGAVRQGLYLLETETFLLLNGDSYCEMDLADLLTRHRQRRAEVTLTVTLVADTSRFGRVEMNAQDRVIRFGEKQENAGPGWINAGIYVLTKSLFQGIPPGGNCSLEGDLLPGWVNSRRLYACKSLGRFLDIGTPADYAGAENSLSTKWRRPKLE